METLAALAALWLVSYVARCAVWPYKPCGHCKGSGKRWSPSGTAFGVCRWCKGTGRRLRFGRRLYDAWRHGTGRSRT